MPSEVDASDQELHSSHLGTKDHWDLTYKTEIENFNNHGDIGDVWFGEDSVTRVTGYITSSDLPKDSSILDLGCGNGYSLLELAAEGYLKLCGVDYSDNAIQLAKEVASKKKFNITYQQGDLINLVSSSDIFGQRFNICHDKGTYDAINLSPEEPLIKRLKYIKNVFQLLSDDGLFIITSVNWTEDELKNHFEDYFELVVSLPAPTFMFGGKIGNRETSLVFKKKG